ncbi:MAG: class B sortase [Defluviitaleaceae bacterium]|nr:class B sortase [Defluviitaleaceae bacterium]
MENRGSKIRLYCASVVLLLSLTAAGYFGVTLFLETREMNQGEDFFEEVSALVEFRTRPNPQQLRPQTTNGADYYYENGSESDSENGNGQEGSAGAPLRPAIGGGTQGGSGNWQAQPAVALTFEELQPRFPNIVGWIQSPGTVINYPIVQGTDNYFYLNHLPDGRRNAMGSIFLDYRNSANFTDQITLLYGHDMRSGNKFGSFRHYRRQSYFYAHSYMFTFTPHQDYLVELFAGYVIDTAQEYTPFLLPSAPEFYAHIDDIVSRSVFHSGLRPEFGDRILKLVTCTPSGPQAERMILVGRLVAVNW